MFFNCCLVHPTVMFRRSLGLDYPLDSPSAEDYAAWLALITEKAVRMCNLGGDPILRLRKHATNVSKSYRSVQSESSLQAVAKALLKVSKRVHITILCIYYKQCLHLPV